MSSQEPVKACISIQDWNEWQKLRHDAIIAFQSYQSTSALVNTYDRLMEERYGLGPNDYIGPDLIIIRPVNPDLSQQRGEQDGDGAKQ